MTLPRLGCPNSPLTLPWKGKNEELWAAWGMGANLKRNPQVFKKDCPVEADRGARLLLEAQDIYEQGCWCDRLQAELGSSGLSLAWVPVSCGWQRIFGGCSFLCCSSPRGVLPGDDLESVLLGRLLDSS